MMPKEKVCLEHPMTSANAMAWRRKRVVCFAPQNDAAKLELAAAEMAQAAANLVSLERELLALGSDGVRLHGACPVRIRLGV